MANEKPQFTIRELTRAQMLASRKGDKELAATLQRVLASRIDRDKASHAFYAALDQGNVPRQRSIFRQMRAAGMALAPRNAKERKRATVRAAKATANAMPWWQKAITGFDQGVTQLGVGARQLIYDPIADAVDPLSGASRSEQDQQLVASRRAADEALKSTGAGFAGNLVGNLAATAPLMAVPVGKMGTLARVGSLAGEGGVLGALQPAESNGERGVNTLVGAALGPAVDVGLRIGARGVRGIGNYLVRALPRNAVRAAERVLYARMENPKQVIHDLANPTRPLRGESPSLSQSTLDPGAARLERAVRNSDEGAASMVDMDINNDRARMNALRRLDLGDEADASSVAARLKARASRPIDRVVRANASKPISVGDIEDSLRVIANAKGSHKNDIASKYARNELKKLRNDMPKVDVSKPPTLDELLAGRTNITANEYKRITERLAKEEETYKQALEDAANKPPESTVEALDAIRRNMKTNVLKLANGDESAQRQALGELTGFDEAMKSAINDVAPGYKAAVDAYADAIAPVNASRAVRKGLQNVRSVNARKELFLTKPDIDRIAKAINHPQMGVKMPASARQAMRDIQDSVRRQAPVNKSFAAPGSPTQANLENSLAGHIRGIGNSAGRYGTLGMIGTGIGAGVGGWWPGGVVGGIVGGGVQTALNLVEHANDPLIARSVSRLIRSPDAANAALHSEEARLARNALIDRALHRAGVGAVPIIAAYRAAHNVPESVTDEDIASLLRYQAGHKNQQPLTIPIINGTAVPASEFNP